MIVRLVDALHAGGRCACAGEGWCAWCRTHCVLCGVVVPWSPEPGPTCGGDECEGHAAAVADRMERLILGDLRFASGDEQ